MCNQVIETPNVNTPQPHSVSDKIAALERSIRELEKAAGRNTVSQHNDT